MVLDMNIRRLLHDIGIYILCLGIMCVLAIPLFCAYIVCHTKHYIRKKPEERCKDCPLYELCKGII